MTWKVVGRLKAESDLLPGLTALAAVAGGDYFGICRDGGNNRHVWGYGEYSEKEGSKWGTWVFRTSY